MVECINGCGQMLETVYENVMIDVCGTCAGVWLDFSEMTSIVDTKDVSWSEATIRKVLEQTGKVGVPSLELGCDINCPKCGEGLPSNNYQNNSGIIVNACLNDHGVWLDSGELVKIQVFMEKWDEVAERDSPKYDKLIKDIALGFEKREALRGSRYLGKRAGALIGFLAGVMESF